MVLPLPHPHSALNVGTMSSTIMHSWHGRKTERGYNAKHALLAKIGFDPLRHLKKDFQGLYQLHDDPNYGFVQLRDMMRKIVSVTKIRRYSNGFIRTRTLKERAKYPTNQNRRGIHKSSIKL